MVSTFRDLYRTSRFHSPTRIVLGTGAVDQTGDEAARLAGTRPLVVTDPGVVEAGLLEGLERSLRERNIEPALFAEVEPEPRAGLVDRAVRVLRDEGCDLVVGFGGGSALDVAKGAASLASCDGGVLDYVGLDTLEERGVPRILIPTTAGTGSEAGMGIVLTDEAENTKKVVVSSHLLADTAILDPDLTLSMPKKVTAATGLDALVHAIESYTSATATPFSEVLGLQAVAMIGRHLPVAYSKGGDKVARYNMLLAANWAGAAFTSGGLAGVHALAYVLGTKYHQPHGLANAIMLPHVMAYNVPGNPEKFARIAEAMGEDVRDLPLHEAARRSVEAVRRLLETVEVSCRLPDYGIPVEDLSALVEGGMAQSRLFAANPRDLMETDVRRIYESAFA